MERDRLAIDAYSPAEVAHRVQNTGVTKANLDFITTLVLGVLGGAFIALGAGFFLIVTTSPGLGFGMARLIGGLAFSLGLILVVIAGAELFTGNNLIVMSWVSGKVTLLRLARNWAIVYLGNLLGALSVVGFIYYSEVWAFQDFAVGADALLIAKAKADLSFIPALARGILCNVLVCLAVWLSYSARSVTDKVLAVLFPVTAFVASGFEHSIANMFFIPLGMALRSNPGVLESAGVRGNELANLDLSGLASNLIPVTLGNIIGGGIMVAAVYWFVYLRHQEGGISLARSRRQE